MGQYWRVKALSLCLKSLSTLRSLDTWDAPQETTKATHRTLKRFTYRVSLKMFSISVRLLMISKWFDWLPLTDCLLPDVPNGFGIFGMDSGVDVDEQKEEAIVAEGDTLTVTCGASNLNYSNITWFFNGKPLKNNDSRCILLCVNIKNRLFGKYSEFSSTSRIHSYKEQHPVFQ